MNEQEKSLKLAELMGFKLFKESTAIYYSESCLGQMWEPYVRSQQGLAQFAAILLKYPEVMKLIHVQFGHVESMWNVVEPTQANILDEILRMNGKL